MCCFLAHRQTVCHHWQAPADCSASFLMPVQTNTQPCANTPNRLADPAGMPHFLVQRPRVRSARLTTGTGGSISPSCCRAELETCPSWLPPGQAHDLILSVVVVVAHDRDRWVLLGCAGMCVGLLGLLQHREDGEKGRHTQVGTLCTFYSRCHVSRSQCSWRAWAATTAARNNFVAVRNMCCEQILDLGVRLGLKKLDRSSFRNGLPQYRGSSNHLNGCGG